jgi:hypothetical protein
MIPPAIPSEKLTIGYQWYRTLIASNPSFVGQQ